MNARSSRVAAILDHNPRLLLAYDTDAQFRAAVDVIVNTLPAFLNLMADQCAEGARLAQQYAVQAGRVVTISQADADALAALLDRDGPR